MSRLLTHTNILVDDFDFAKSFPKNSFVHFLTHFHSDHYEGLSPLWNYGSIHCTHQTKKFIMNKYPKLKDVHSYDYYKPNIIELIPGKLKVQFTFFDAKHIPGSSMILFQGYMGTIFFTGDFRYEYSMVKENQILFPLQNRENQTKQQIVQSMKSISIHIDEMIFDNTYCNKVFDFQTQNFIANKIIKIIADNKDKRLVLIAMGALGKHRILLKIAQHFQTNIIVSQKQLQKIQVANLNFQFLSTDPDQGYIHLISKKRRAQIIQQTKKGQFGDNFICIDTDFLMLEHQSPDDINFIVPYSLHSNYKQMETFIRMINPSILRKLVIPFSNFKQVKLRIKIDHRLKFAKYLDFLTSKLEKSQSGYSYLVRHYTSVYQLSEQYLKWFSKKSQKYLMESFGLGQGDQNHKLRKRMPKFLEEEQYTFKSSSQSKSLRNIADSLNAVNKNMTLQKCLKKGQQSKMNKQYDKLIQKFNNEKEQDITQEETAQSKHLISKNCQNTFQ